MKNAKFIRVYILLCCIFSMQLISFAQDSSEIPPIVQQWIFDAPDGWYVLADNTPTLSLVGYSHDGSEIAAVNGQMWNIANGELVADFSDNENENIAYHFLYNPDGSRLIVIRNNIKNTSSTIEAYNETGNSPLWNKNHSFVVSITFSPDGLTVAVLSNENSFLRGSGSPLEVWNLETGERIWRSWMGTCRLGRIQYSPDGNQIIQQCSDSSGQVDYIDSATGEFEGGTYCNNATVLPNGKIVCSRSSGILFLTPEGRSPVVDTEFLSQHYVDAIFPSSEGPLILLSSEGYLSIHDRETGGALSTVNIPQGLRRSNYSLSPNQEYFALAVNNQIEIISLANRSRVLTWTTPDDEIEHIEFSPDGLQLLSVARNRHIIVWDIAEPNPLEGSSTVLGLQGVNVEYLADPDAPRFRFFRDVTIPESWSPPPGSSARYLIRFLSYNEVLYENCRYQPIGGGETITVNRIRGDIDVEIVDLQTNTVIMRQTFVGATPEPCPDTTFGLAILNGDPDPSEFREWLRDFNLTYLSSRESESGDSECMGTVTASSSSVNLRSGPGTGFGVIGALANGSQISLMSRSQDWYQIIYNGQEAWIWSQLVAISGANCADLTQQ